MKNDIADKLKAILLTPLKLQVEKVSTNFNRTVLNFLLKTKIINEGNCCKFYDLKDVWTFVADIERCMDTTFIADIERCMDRTVMANIERCMDRTLMADIERCVERTVMADIERCMDTMLMAVIEDMSDEEIMETFYNEELQTTKF